jgi:hypothetical protein
MNKHSPELVHYTNGSYFPLLIFLTKTKTTMVVQTPEDIPSGVSFRVWGTRYTGKPYETFHDVCGSGWTGDRCMKPLGHEGPHSN